MRKHELEAEFEATFNGAMMKRVVVRPMHAGDISAVLEIQSHCYDETKLESFQAFLAKFEATPNTCFIALLADVPAGYLVALPVVEGHPPPLNGTSYSVPQAANSLYLHDLAVLPKARGTGAADALVAAYFQALKQSQVQFGCLTAVNASSSYWERFGFRPAALADESSGHMLTYGEGAQYMSLRVGV